MHYYHFYGNLDDAWEFKLPSFERHQKAVFGIWAASWENGIISYAKTKAQISFAVTAKLISAFVFATWIVQFFFLKPKFQSSSLFLKLYRPVCVGLIGKPWRPVFSHRGSFPTRSDSSQPMPLVRRMLGAWNFRFKKKRKWTIQKVKTKALISCSVTAQLICAFVFT